jgi:insulysin
MNTLLLLLAALTQPLTEDVPMPPYTEIADTSALPMLNPDLKQRQSSKLRLENGLEVLIISDPQADQSSASVSVSSGSWHDPAEYPGMAHFCEHMLFLGTKKYPDPNEFMTKIADFGGMTNAFTQPHQTVYMFSCKHDGFLENVDRFSRFFIDPLFSQAHVERELHAVEQEYAKNLENDRWREYMIFKELGNPKHPNRKFSSGNAETLSGIPSKSLIDWHKSHYGSENMHLFVYSNIPMDELKTKIASMYNQVPKLDEEALAASTEAIMCDNQKGKIAYIKPIQDQQILTMSWELPASLSDEPTQSAALIAHALNRGQSHSLYEKLKKEQLINSLGIYAEDVGGKGHKFFYVMIDLSDQGAANVDKTITRVYEAIAGLKETGIPDYLFQEKNTVSELKYQYQGRVDAFHMAESIGESLSNETLSTYPREQILASSYSPEKIQETLKLLTPDSCYIAFAASPSVTGVTPDKKERWFGAEYALNAVPSDWMAKWKAAKPNPEITLAGPNPFLPKQLDQVAASGSIPSLLAESDSGIAYYCRASEFAGPEAVIHLHIRTPELTETAKSSVLSALYLDHLTDDLHPTLSAARVAGLTARFDLEKLKLHVQVSGFSDKAPLLLAEIIRLMPLNVPTKEQFDIYISRTRKDYANGDKALPVYQAKDLLDSLLVNEKFNASEKLAAIQTITYNDFVEFHKNLFAKTYSEALFTGNLTLYSAQSAWIDVQHTLSKGIYPKADHVNPKVLQLPSKSGPFSVIKTTEAQGNCAILAIDAGNFSFESRAAHEVLGSALREAFFNELRTKQKTGYIAKADPAEIEEKLFQLFLVQSNSHQPEDLLYRFELFNEEFLETISEGVPKERFDMLKQSAIHSLKTRFRNLKDKSALWNQLAFDRRADFNFVNTRIKALEALSYEQFLSFAKTNLSRSNLKRLAVLYEGRLNAPFAYEPVELNKLKEISEYVGKKPIESAQPVR